MNDVASGGSVLRASTRTHHNARVASSRKILYPYHPLFGQELEVLDTAAGERDVIYVKLSNNTTRGIPAWMFDEVICARVRSVEHPVVEYDALFRLAELLDSAKGRLRSGANESTTASSEKPTAQAAQHPTGLAVRRPQPTRTVPTRKSKAMRATAAGLVRSSRSPKRFANGRRR